MRNLIQKSQELEGAQGFYDYKKRTQTFKLYKKMMIVYLADFKAKTR